jgi:hypothetical protein
MVVPRRTPIRRLTALCCWVKVAECRLPCYAAPLVLGAWRCGPACQALRTVRSGWLGAALVSGDRHSVIVQRLTVRR